MANRHPKIQEKIGSLEKQANVICEKDLFDQFCFDFIAIVFSIFFFKMPKLVGVKLEGIQRRFLSGEGGMRRKERFLGLLGMIFVKARMGVV